MGYKEQVDVREKGKQAHEPNWEAVRLPRWRLSPLLRI